MEIWNYASKPDADGNNEMKISIEEDDTTGAITGGNVLFRGMHYVVHGQWAASGSVPGRNYSVLWFGGTNSDNSIFLVAAGDINFSSEPRHIDIAVTTASSHDGTDFGYNGRLFCTD